MNAIKLILISIVFSTFALGQKSIESTTVLERIKIDGFLDEAIWKEKLTENAFVQIEPKNGELSTQRTKIAILNDESYLYVAAELSMDSTVEINSKLSPRDDTGNADYFGVILDPFGASREGWAFYVTPANVQSDIKVTNDDDYDQWNAIWQSATNVSGNKWSVEMKIPFNSLRFPKENLSNFSINFERFISQNNETSFWNFVDVNVDGFLNQFGQLTNLKRVNPPENFSLFPFASTMTEKDVDGNVKTNFVGGLDMKYVYKNAYTLDVSLIPDFSQAPSDNQVFNLSPFDVQYDENRQFFVEGTELFDKGGYLYTRKIGGEPILNSNVEYADHESIIENPVSSNILSLVKFTGKSESGLSIGVLNGVTDRSNALIRNRETGDTRTVMTSPLINYNSIVLDQTLNNNSSITLINNSVLRDGSTYDANLTAGLLRLYNKKRTYSLSLKKAISQKYFSQKKDEFGHAFNARVMRVSGKWTGGLVGSLQDENFDNNDFGYNPRNNNLSYYGVLNYAKSDAKNIFSAYEISLIRYQRMYYSLRTLDRTFYGLEFYGQRTNNHRVFMEFRFDNLRKDFYEPRVADRFFEKPKSLTSFFEYQTNRSKNVSFAGYFEIKNHLYSQDFTYEIESGYGLTALIGEHIATSLEQSVDLSPKNWGYISKDDGEILFGQRDLMQLTNDLTVNYTVNAKLHVQALIRHYWIQVDYKEQKSLDLNGQLISNTRDINMDDFNANFNAFNIDVLAKWQFAPGSELSLGYKLGATVFDDNIESGYFSNLDNILQQKNSSNVSLKITYLLDFNKFKR